MRPGTRAEQAFRRRLVILTHLHCRPHRYDEMQGLLAEAGFADPAASGDPATAGRRRDEWHADLEALRAAGYTIGCDRRTGLYAWADSPFGLALSDTQLLAFGIILDTFADTTMLHHAEIHDLLTTLFSRLPATQQTALERKRRPYHVDLRETTDYRSADPATVRMIEAAIEQGQQLEIRYARAKGGTERTHTVEPRPLIYKSGHIYLPVYNVVLDKAFELRLDGIMPGSARVLPRRAQPARPPGRVYPLQYRLTPVIAGRGVSDHFPGQRVEQHPDGSATVTAFTGDLFAARRVLLAYGENCTVLSPPELIADLRRTVAALHQRYCSAEA